METLPSTDRARVARRGRAGRRVSARDSVVGGASAWGGVGVLVVASEGSSGERLGAAVLFDERELRTHGCMFAGGVLSSCKPTIPPF
jgi:hypothetical protein